MFVFRPVLLNSEGVRSFGAGCVSATKTSKSLPDGTIMLASLVAADVGRPERDGRRRPAGPKARQECAGGVCRQRFVSGTTTRTASVAATVVAGVIVTIYFGKAISVRRRPRRRRFRARDTSCARAGRTRHERSRDRGRSVSARGTHRDGSSAPSARVRPTDGGTGRW